MATLKSLGFVPTMGALHEGHLSLVRESLKTCKETVVSIYVNPMQFALGEDFEAYPRQVDRDVAVLKELGVDRVFLPMDEEIYPGGLEGSFRVDVGEIGTRLCGQSRPHFFGGVASVVLRLLQIVRPSVAFFGEKDFQQLMVIRQLVRDFFLDVEIVGYPIIREASGLAMSSRNQYLSQTDRERLGVIYRGLQMAREAGVEKGREVMAEVPELREDYFEIVSEWDRVFYAGVFKGVRLIDNLGLSVTNNRLIATS